MAVTAASLAAALGIAVADASDQNDPGIVEGARLLALAGPLVNAYLRGGTAPDAVRDEAIIRTAGHVQARGLGFGVIDKTQAGSVKTGLTPAGVSPVRQSGAAGLLAPYVRRTA